MFLKSEFLLVYMGSLPRNQVLQMKSFVGMHLYEIQLYKNTIIKLLM